MLILLGLDLASLVRSEHARRAIDRAADVREKAGLTVRLLADAETGQRGFLLTREVDYLEPYERARVEIPATMQGLATLVWNQPTQRAQVERLDELVTAKLAELGETVDLEKAGAHQRAIALVQTRRGKRTMDEARAIVAEMEGAADQILARNNASAAFDKYLDLIVTALAGAALVAVGILLYSAGRQLERRSVSPESPTSSTSPVVSRMTFGALWQPWATPSISRDGTRTTPRLRMRWRRRRRGCLRSEL